MLFLRRHILSEFMGIIARIFICFIIPWHCYPSFVTAAGCATFPSGKANYFFAFLILSI